MHTNTDGDEWSSEHLGEKNDENEICWSVISYNLERKTVNISDIVHIYYTASKIFLTFILIYVKPIKKDSQNIIWMLGTLNNLNPK